MIGIIKYNRTERNRTEHLFFFQVLNRDPNGTSSGTAWPLHGGQEYWYPKWWLYTGYKTVNKYAAGCRSVDSRADLNSYRLLAEVTWTIGTASAKQNQASDVCSIMNEKVAGKYSSVAR